MKYSTTKKLAITITFLCCFLGMIKAQNTSLKTWTGITYERKIKIKKFKFKTSIKQQFRVANIRYNPNYALFTEIGVSKKITDYYKIGVKYRVNYLNQIKHRISVSNSFKIEKEPITIGFRIKYQAEFEHRSPFSQDFRAKLSLKYKANKDFRPYIFSEILYNNTYNYSNFDQYRIGVGLDADYKRKNQFDVMIMYTQEINAEEPQKSFVLGLFYTFAH